MEYNDRPNQPKGMSSLHSFTHSILFPYEKARKYQNELIQTIHNSISEPSHLLIQAPTGLGKTISSLAAILPEALRTKKTVFFLTSRTTQHEIVLESIQSICDAFKLHIPTISITSKKEVCPFHEQSEYSIRDFSKFCARAKDSGTCPYYSGTYDDHELTADANSCLRRLEQQPVVSYTDARRISSDYTVCPYEILIALAQSAQVIVCDYNYVFNPSIQKRFLGRTKKKLDDSIIIIDETHNLPDRIQSYQTRTITTTTISRLIEQIEQIHLQDIIPILQVINRSLVELGKDLAPRQKVMATRELFVDELVARTGKQFDVLIEELETYDELLDSSEANTEHISLGRVIQFMELWDQDLNSHARIISKEPDDNSMLVKLTCKSLDPREIASEVIKESYATIGMSATLKPMEMYRDILGFPKEETKLQGFPSPFPKENNCSLILPIASTQYKTRSIQEFKKIATVASTIIDEVPGNTIIFYPSYDLLHTIRSHLSTSRPEFFESAMHSKMKKRHLLNEFKKQSKKGASLHAVVGGSFSEGIDLPGDFVKCVLIVGLPFARPDLEIKAQISYYQHLFGKGLDYAYIFPALNKVVQSAGRCIRSDTDKGLIIYLDTRYDIEKYKQCLSDPHHIKSMTHYLPEVQRFFHTE